MDDHETKIIKKTSKYINNDEESKPPFSQIFYEMNQSNSHIPLNAKS